MIIFDKKPTQIKKGALINWVSPYDITPKESSARLINNTFKKSGGNIRKHVDRFDGDPSELLGTVLITKNGALSIYNAFVYATVHDDQQFNPFAAIQCVRFMLDDLSTKPKSKCYMSVLDDDESWESIKKPITTLEARYKTTIWICS